MKVRLDFVTNSSSSSFVVTLENGKTYSDFKECVVQMLEAHNKLANTTFEYSDIFDDNVSSDTKQFEIWNAYDNSIPYWLREYLEYTLGAERTYHG